MRWAPAAFVVVATTLAACRYETNATLIDPSRVTIYSAHPGESFADAKDVVLPPTAATAVFVPGVDVSRRPDQSIVIGETELVDPTGKVITSDVGAEDVAPRSGDMNAEFRVPYTYTVSSASWQTGNAMYTQWRYVTPVIATPWSNVRTVESTRKPERMWGMLLIPGAIFTAVGVLLFAAAPTEPGWGATFTAIGVPLDVLAIVLLATPASRKQVWPAPATPAIASSDGRFISVR